MAEGLAVPPPGGRWTWPAVAGVLLAAFVAASYSESAGKSPSSDEPPHLASGLAYVERGVFYGNQQHPPLLKELSGLSLLLGGIRLPNTAETELLLSGRRVAAQPEWAAGSQILEKNGYDRTLFWARLPFPLIAAMGGAMIFFLGRRLVGEAAAAGGVFLFAADPTILAHSYLVTTDVGFAAFTMLFLFTLWRYIEKPDARRLVCCGLALGAMLCAKFSAVLLLPVAGVLVLVGLGQRNPAAKTQAVGRNQPCPCGSGKKYKACHGSGEADAAALAGGLGQWRGLIRAGALFLGICGIAYLTIQAIYFLPSDPLVYLEGVRRVNADHIRGYLFMMAGQVREWFVSYFAVAYLLKEPLAGIVLTAIGLATLLRNRAISRLTKLFLLLPPLAVFLGATLWADRMGIRYIMPVLPFAHLLGGYGLATLWSMTAKWARPAAAALCVWVAVATAGIYPDHLSYFNETACLLTAPGKVGMDGGSQCGRFWLDDSNVDWGQGLKQLKRWLDVNAPGRTVRLVNPFHVNPAAYGIKAVDADMLELVRQPQAGLYAVTAHLAARVPVYPGTSRWLKEVEPVALVGHSFFIYDLPGPPAAQ